MSVIRAELRLRPRVRRIPDKVWLLALVGSAVVGVALTISLEYGIALLIALLYVPMVLTDMVVGLALWIPLPFLQGVGSIDAASKAAGLLVALAWFALLRERRAAVRRAISENRVMFAAVVGSCLWVTLSTAWASDPSRTESDLWHWYGVALILLVIVTSIESRGAMQWVGVAFVIGAVLSVLYGLVGGTSGAEASNAAAYGGNLRLGGATGDPNYLAAGVVAAMVLGGVLVMSVREVRQRTRPLALVVLMACLILLTIGLVLTESRGGLVAALAGVAVAFVAFPGQRRWVLGIVLILVGISAVGFALSPTALNRVTSTGNGSGRTDLWTVALRAIKAHPLAGVGDANFPVIEANYTRAPGTLTDAEFVVQQPSVVHDTYLQLMAEEGIVGLALFAAIAGASLRAAMLAAKRFAARGDRAMELFSRGAAVALVAFLVASAFISSQVDQRLWILFALGPVVMLLSKNDRVRPRPLAR